MAAVTAPGRTSAQHQSLLHFVGEGNWCDEKVLAKVREMVLPAIVRHGPIEAWIIDDTGFPKKGRHSVGVARQYCGELGKQDNCQIVVTLSIANHHASLPVAYRLYLPKEWATDRPRRRKAGVPKEVTFKTKPAIALEQLRWACAAGLPRGVVLMDAGYGTDTDLRTSITELGLSYVAGIQPQTSVWAPGTGPQPPENKLRWRIERDYHELKQEVGLGHFEGRGWRGLHHHATLCIAAYGFLVSERETIPPSATGSARLFKEITIPETYRPRGSAIAA
jgi:SRSO17 transposase